MSDSHLFNSDKERIEYSRHPCELCRSSLAGERYIAVQLDENFNGVELEICVDCYLEIGG
jgi:ribosome-binding protein aMBF1 (putative translation factor)